MPKRRVTTAKQRAAARRNLIKARAARKRGTPVGKAARKATQLKVHPVTGTTSVKLGRGGHRSHAKPQIVQARKMSAAEATALNEKNIRMMWAGGWRPRGRPMTLENYLAKERGRYK